MIKTCKHCKKEFETNNPQKLYCDGEHYQPCPVCSTPVLMYDNDFSRKPPCCSGKCKHELRKKKLPKRKCELCGDEFIPTTGVGIICSKQHSRPCEICGKLIPWISRNDTKTTCSSKCTQEKLKKRSQEKYGTNHPMQNLEVQQKFKQTMLDRYGVEHALQNKNLSIQQQANAINTNLKNNNVPYACLLPQCIEAQGKIISDVNVKFSEKLKQNMIKYKFEHRIENCSYDIILQETNILLELNPTYTHSAKSNHWGISRPCEYHLSKTQLANKHGYRCIHIFDWDDESKIIHMLIPTKSIYARQLKLFKLHSWVADDFLRKYHIQGTCKGQLLHLGLVKNGVLYQVMTFGKSRYSKSHDVELLRLCTLPGFRVIGGASKLFSFATKEYGLWNIISYCDLSKFTGDVYTKIGMQFLRNTPPQEVWSKGNDKITANLLRQRGFDQLFKTNFGKGTSNEELMLHNGWLPVYDCGQVVYEFK